MRRKTTTLITATLAAAALLLLAGCSGNNNTNGGGNGGGTGRVPESSAVKSGDPTATLTLTSGKSDKTLQVTLSPDSSFVVPSNDGGTVQMAGAFVTLKNTSKSGSISPIVSIAIDPALSPGLAAQTVNDSALTGKCENKVDPQGNSDYLQVALANAGDRLAGGQMVTSCDLVPMATGGVEVLAENSSGAAQYSGSMTLTGTAFALKG